MRILVTRPLSESERTAAALTRLGHDALLAPMLSIEANDFTLPQGSWSGVVMTSANAARAVAGRVSHLMPLPVFAVGGQTAAAAQDAGFVSVISADGDGGDLVELVAARGLQQPLIYFAGNDRARDLAAELGAQGIRLETVVVYRADPVTAFTSDVADAIRRSEIDGVLHYSRRTSEAFCRSAKASGLEPEVIVLKHYCLSDRAAEPIAAAGAKSLYIAASPDESALFRLLAQA